MKLVYLWVEDYKNIHEQGFNFSPKFNCHYDGETLTIKDNVDEDGNKQYIENFFGNNINVTAIVGKNGSGKSSLLELISYIIASKEFDIVFMLLTFSEENGFSLYVKDINPRETFVTKTINIQSQKHDLFGIFYSSNFSNGNFDNETRWFATPFQPTLNKSEFEENTFAFEGKTNENLLTQSIFNLFINSPKYLSELKIFSYSDGQGSFGSGQLKSLIYHAKTILIANFLQKNIQHIPFEISGGIAIHINESRYNKYSSNMLEAIREHISYPLHNDIITLLERGECYNDFYIVDFDIFFDILDIYFNYIFNSEGAVDFLQFAFNSLSSGEENYILMLALLESGIHSHLNKEKEETNIILLLDEPEHTFHPEWQKNTINYLLSFLNSIIDENEVIFHILLTSHSPFLLSDLPKENIIFLDKYTENDKETENKQQKIGNCKVVDGLKQTFGANIHTLLSDSFFMDGGLMGKFAKQKINEIIAFFDNKNELYKNDQEKLLTIINSIGEPFLKDKLLFMYNEKYPKTDEEKILELEKQIESIKNGQNKV